MGAAEEVFFPLLLLVELSILVGVLLGVVEPVSGAVWGGRCLLEAGAGLGVSQSVIFSMEILLLALVILLLWAETAGSAASIELVHCTTLILGVGVDIAVQSAAGVFPEASTGESFNLLELGAFSAADLFVFPVRF